MRQKLYFTVMLALFSVESASAAQELSRSNSILVSLQSITASTIPPNDDVNPYGVAFVPAGFPAGANIAAGDVLVANFNNSSHRDTATGIAPDLQPQWNASRRA
jgi:hypothetical protein